VSCKDIERFLKEGLDLVFIECHQKNFFLGSKDTKATAAVQITQDIIQYLFVEFLYEDDMLPGPGTCANPRTT
jgi:hypothetical protein